MEEKRREKRRGKRGEGEKKSGGKKPRPNAGLEPATFYSISLVPRPSSPSILYSQSILEKERINARERKAWERGYYYIAHVSYCLRRNCTYISVPYIANLNFHDLTIMYMYGQATGE